MWTAPPMSTAGIVCAEQGMMRYEVHAVGCIPTYARLIHYTAKNAAIRTGSGDFMEQTYTVQHNEHSTNRSYDEALQAFESR